MRSHRWRPVGALSLVVLFAIACDKQAPADGGQDPLKLVGAADVAHQPPPKDEDVELPGDVPDLTGAAIEYDYRRHNGKLIVARTTALLNAVAPHGRVHFRKAVAWFAFCEYGDVAACQDASGKLDVNKVVRIGIQAVRGSRRMDPTVMRREGGRVFARVRVLNATAMPSTPSCNIGLAALARDIGMRGKSAYWYIAPDPTDANGIVGFVLLDAKGADELDIRRVAHWYWKHTADGLKHEDVEHGDVADNEAGAQFRSGDAGSRISQPVVFNGLDFDTDPGWNTRGVGDATLAASVEPGCGAGPLPTTAASPAADPGAGQMGQNLSVPENKERPGSGLWISCMSGCCASGSDFGRFASAAPPAADDRKQQKKKGT